MALRMKCIQLDIEMSGIVLSSVRQMCAPHTKPLLDLHMPIVDERSKGHFAIEGLARTFQVYFLTLYSLKQLYYSRSIVLKPCLRQIVNGNSLNFADLWLTNVHFHPSTTLHMDKIGHVTSDTRPSHFSACNIEKLGMHTHTQGL